MQSNLSVLGGEDRTPNYELLRRLGWSLGTISGDYCLAWQGRAEGIFHWRDGEWVWLGGNCQHDGIQTSLAG